MDTSPVLKDMAHLKALPAKVTCTVPRPIATSYASGSSSRRSGTTWCAAVGFSRRRRLRIIFERLRRSLSSGESIAWASRHDVGTDRRVTAPATVTRLRNARRDGSAC